MVKEEQELLEAKNRGHDLLLEIILGAEWPVKPVVVARLSPRPLQPIRIEGRSEFLDSASCMAV